MERRQFRRIPFRHPVCVSLPNGKEVLLSAMDYSISGIGLLTDKQPDLGEVIRLQYHINPDGHVREIDIKGEVRHIDTYNSDYYIGLSFL